MSTPNGVSAMSHSADENLAVSTGKRKRDTEPEQVAGEVSKAGMHNDYRRQLATFLEDMLEVMKRCGSLFKWEMRLCPLRDGIGA